MGLLEFWSFFVEGTVLVRSIEMPKVQAFAYESNQIALPVGACFGSDIKSQGWIGGLPM